MEPARICRCNAACRHCDLFSQLESLNPVIHVNPVENEIQYVRHPSFRLAAVLLPGVQSLLRSRAQEFAHPDLNRLRLRANRATDDRTLREEEERDQLVVPFLRMKSESKFQSTL